VGAGLKSGSSIVSIYHVRSTDALRRRYDGEDQDKIQIL
jgi:hypothetical protein